MLCCAYVDGNLFFLAAVSSVGETAARSPTQQGGRIRRKPALRRRGGKITNFWLDSWKRTRSRANESNHRRRQCFETNRRLGVIVW